MTSVSVKQETNYCTDPIHKRKLLPGNNHVYWYFNWDTSKFQRRTCFHKTDYDGLGEHLPAN